MPIDYNRPAPASPARSFARHLGLLGLRLVTGTALQVWHGWREGLLAWSHLWHKTAWDLPAQLAALGFPFSIALAGFLVITTLLGSVLLVLGLLTRLSAVVLAVLAVITAVLYAAYPMVAELAVLYAGACLTIALCGPGAFALDRLLRLVATKRPQSRK
jgi:uncharacterized membrane protein YphA (DoxX/SURF4 family)